MEARENRKRSAYVGIPLLALALVALLLWATPQFSVAQTNGVTINEIRIDQPGTDNDEYFELAGTAGTSLDNLTYLVIGDGIGGSGEIEAVVDLSGQSIPADGFFLAVESTFSLSGGGDLTTTLNFENSDNVTHLLVEGFTGSTGQDLDTDDDGVLDVTPWTAVLDCVALIETVGSGDQVYCSTTVGPDGSYVPSHVYRCPAVGWVIGQFDPVGGMDTPGVENQCLPDLTITKSGPNLLFPGGIVTYTIAYSNTGLGDAPSVVITDMLPANVLYLTDSSGLDCPACAVNATGPLTWTVGTISVAHNYSFTLTALVSNSVSWGSTLTNVITITTISTESTTANNSDSWASTVSPLDLVVSKSGLPFAVAGETTTYVITVTNQGITIADGIILTDTLPVSATFVTQQNTCGAPCPACTVGATGVLTWNIGTLAAGFACVVDLQVRLDVAGYAVLTNTVEATTVTPGDNPSNNTDKWKTTTYPMVSIHDIQYVSDPATDDASPYVGKVVWVEGVVVAGTDEIGYSNNNFVIEHPAGGAWNGLMVFNGGTFPDVAEGDYVRLLGTVQEYNGMTELSIRNAPNAQEVISKGNSLPMPAVINTGDYVNAGTAEQWESVLIEFRAAEVTDPNLGYGEWAFDDGSGAARADDFGKNDGDLTYTPQLGDYYKFIRGIGWYSYGNYKLEPRYDADIDLDYPVTFVYHDAEDVIHVGEDLYLAGDFNGWSTSALSMTANADASVFSVTVALDMTGTQEYKYVVKSGGDRWDWLNTVNRSVQVTGTMTVHDYRNVAVGYAHLMSPPTMTVNLGETTGPIRGEVYIQNVTNPAGEGRAVWAELGYGTASDPNLWTWTPLTFTGNQNGNNDIYTATLTPMAAGVYSYAVRFDGNRGAGNPNIGWTYGDLDGVYPGNPFELAQTGILTVTAPNLTLTKSVTPTADVELGDVVTYTILLNNSGDGAATAVTLIDTLPAAVSFGGWVQQGGAIQAGGTITWTGDVAAGSQVSIVFTATVSNTATYAGQTITNTATFTSSNAGNGSDDAGFAVAPLYHIYLPLVTRNN